MLLPELAPQEIVLALHVTLLERQRGEEALGHVCRIDHIRLYLLNVLLVVEIVRPLYFLFAQFTFSRVARFRFFAAGAQEAATAAHDHRVCV